MRATTTNGVVIGVKAIEHKVEGSLEFWADAIARRIRDGEGYELLESSDVQSADGTAGRTERRKRRPGSDRKVKRERTP